MIDEKYFVDWDTERKMTTEDVTPLYNEKAVIESIKNILLCEPGERVYNPEFGCPLKKYLFAPLDTDTLLGVHDAVYNAISNFEPRITDLEVSVFADEDKHDIIIDVSFVIIGSNKPTKFRTTIKKIR